MNLRSEYAQIFHIVTFLGKEAVLAIQTMRDQLVVRINIVKDSICISLMTSREHDDLEVLAGFLKTFHDVRSDIDACIDGFLVREVNLKHNVWILSLDVVNAMNQRLVHVKYGKFFLYIQIVSH